MCIVAGGWGSDGNLLEGNSFHMSLSLSLANQMVTILQSAAADQPFSFVSWSWLRLLAFEHGAFWSKFGGREHWIFAKSNYLNKNELDYYLLYITARVKLVTMATFVFKIPFARICDVPASWQLDMHSLTDKGSCSPEDVTHNRTICIVSFSLDS